ncbi:MAG: glycosyl hydrolase 53 family protein [Prolixibacteraceae bacterium]
MLKSKFIFLLLFISSYLITSAQSDFIIGQDLSYVNQMEDCGAQYREDGEVKDVYQIFADNGSNLIRVRLWHNPSWQESLKQPDGVKAIYSDFEDVKETIFRAKMAGMQVMLGFHFSDFWCDPGRQILPKAWESVSGNETALKDSIYNYVFQTLNRLNKENLMPEYVKIGNENNSGIMTHKGMNADHEGVTLLSWDWARHGRLYNAAIKAVRDISSQTTIHPKIALHVADPGKAEWFYNNIISNGVTDFDIMGFTYYYSYHKQSPAEVGQYIKKLKTQHPGYDAMVVETGYLWDKQNIDGLGNIITGSSPDYQPVSPATQKQFMVDLSNEVKNAGGSGVIFWESAWVSTPCRTPWGIGSSQEHVAFFDHRDKLNYMKDGGGGWPDEFWNETTKTTSLVTFKVDMTNQDVSRGVYVVGTMTGWEFLQMEPVSSGSKIYQTTMDLTIGGAHAFYYITSSNWENFENYRETVPEECANSDEILNDAGWTTDRAFIVPEKDTVLAFAWASCQSLHTSLNQINHPNQLFKVYPNPTLNQSFMVEMNLFQENFELKIFNQTGRQEAFCFEKTNTESTFKIEGLERGIYFISLTVNQQNYTQKLMVL